MKIFFDTFWKILAFFSAIFLLIIILAFFSSLYEKKSYFDYFSGDKNSEQKIALIDISGPIISNPKKIYDFKIFNSLNSIYPSLITNYLKELETENIKALIISIDSPGGSVSATKEIYDTIVEFKEKNKVIVYFHTNNILASGGYWISQSGDKIFANYGALIGSIGVKGPDWVYYNSPTSLSTGLLGNSVESPSGIKLFSNIAGKSKDILNPFREPTENEELMLNRMVNDIYNDFVILVAKNRKIENSIIINEIGAMIYNTKRAKQNLLIDDQKNITQIIKLLKKELKVDSLKIISNNENNNYNFINLNYLNNKLNMDLEKKYENIIKNKFCNNLLTQFSSALVNINNFNC
tara:strand:+ start:860 stop:1912 length:1053 start_codon:yes stop_codon:yes gene_type:complete